jgi:hypothetical protein
MILLSFCLPNHPGSRASDVPSISVFLKKLPSEMEPVEQSIKPFLVIGKPDDQGRQRGEEKTNR